jgi:hypothetical protein
MVVPVWIDGISKSWSFAVVTSTAEFNYIYNRLFLFSFIINILIALLLIIYHKGILIKFRRE